MFPTCSQDVPIGSQHVPDIFPSCSLYIPNVWKDRRIKEKILVRCLTLGYALALMHRAKSEPLGSHPRALIWHNALEPGHNPLLTVTHKTESGRGTFVFTKP
jgi:hypothetical protein